MIVLLPAAFVVGLVAGISPCILPVLPIIVAGAAGGAGSPSGARSSKWRPFSIVVGLVASFTFATLLGSTLLSLIGLPQSFLRDAGLGVLALLAISLLFSPLGERIEQLFARIGGHQIAGSGSGFVLGLSLGLVFVPCAGPLLATIIVVAADHRVSIETLFVTAAFGLGAAIPLLVLATLIQRSATSWKPLREHMPTVRRVAGAVLSVMVVVLALNLTAPLQVRAPAYASSLENQVDGSGSINCQLQKLRGAKCTARSPNPNHSRSSGLLGGGADLETFGSAPPFVGISHWLNTPAGKPLSISGLRGHVVLVDFWTYSCINCQRTLPHVEAWYNTYSPDGLVVVGVHTPEFAFEHDVSNVASAARSLGVDYPIAIDNDYRTWNAYGNEYWPAEYLIDQRGNIRHEQFGEGDYTGTEAAIRALLQAGGVATLPPSTDVANQTPNEATTEETYLGERYIAERAEPYIGTPIVEGRTQNYIPAAKLSQGQFTFGGTWTVSFEEATAGPSANLELFFEATDVYLVMGGQGTVTVEVNGAAVRSISVSGIPNLYTLIAASSRQSGLLELKISPGVEAYDFTFG